MEMFLMQGTIVPVIIGLLSILIFYYILKKSILFNVVVVIIVLIISTSILSFLIGSTGSLVHTLWGVPVSLICGVIGFKYLNSKLRSPLVEIESQIKKLSEGDTSIRFSEKSQSGSTEVTKISKSLKSLTGSLQSISEFATHIGKGELNIDYHLLGDNDVLGKSMLGMKDNMLKTAAEATEHRTMEEHRNWGTTGLAKFAEILRQDNDDMEALSYNIISNLVKYIDANQGGIFILNEDDGDEKFLELKACYAFDRRKYVQKKIMIGEGLVGTCFLEGESIYMTQIPDSYITITSGLGDATPKALLISPLKVNDQIYGILELASFKPLEPYQLEFVEKLCESIAASISSVKINIRTNRLLTQAKLQAEEMANQEEELRQNMEEMQATQEEMRRRELEQNDLMEKMAEMQKISEAQKEEMDQFYSIIRNSFNMLEFSPDGLIIDINQNVINTFENMTRENFIGRHVSEFIGEEGARTAWEKVSKGIPYEDMQKVETGEGKIEMFKQKFIPISVGGVVQKVILLTYLIN